MRRKRRRPAQKFNRKMRTKLMVLFSLILAVLCGLVGRLTYIEHTKGETYQKKVLSMQSYDSKTIPYQRGEIIDRSGTVLATSVAVYNVILDCTVVNDKEEYVDPTVEALVKCFPELDETEIRRIIKEKKDKRYIVLAKKVPYDEVQPFVELQDAVDKKGNKVNPDIKGVWFEKEYQRNYPFGSLASSVIGFTSSGNVGTTGLENYYNSTLNGINGREYGYLDSDSDFEKTVIDAQDGDALVTSIDANIQSIVEEKIKDWNEKYRDNYYKGTGSINTAAIVMNPNNGEILAMVNVPEFDLNEPFTLNQDQEISEKSKEALNQMWRNGCINDTYEPGSTFKIITASACLEERVVSLSDTFSCPGYRIVEDRKIRCHKVGGHGAETFVQGIQNSCNPVFIDIGLRLGTGRFCDYFEQFGLLGKTGVDLPGEAATIMHKEENIGQVELATMSFGQSFQVTPIQMAATVSALVNGGKRVTPHFGVRILDKDKETVRELKYDDGKQIVSEETSRTMQALLESVVSEGSGKNAKIEGYHIGGKTATSQTLPRSANKYISSFIGFAPAANPQILGMCVIYNPQGVYYGGTIAAPVIRDIFDNIFPYLGIEKDVEMQYTN